MALGMGDSDGDELDGEPYHMKRRGTKQLVAKELENTRTKRP